MAAPSLTYPNINTQLSDGHQLAKNFRDLLLALTDGTKDLTVGVLVATNLSGTNTGDVTLAAIGSSANANGASLSGQVLNLQPASGSFGGIVTAGTQTFSGSKTISSTSSQAFNVICSANDALMTIEGVDGGVGTGGNLSFIYTKTGSGAGSRTVAKVLGLCTNVTPASAGGLWRVQTATTAGTLTLALAIDQIQDVYASAGNILLSTIGKTFYIAEGSNAKMGVVTLVAGTATVSTTAVTANSRIFLTAQSLGTITVGQGLGISARTAGTSFTILSQSALDTSVVAWIIFEPTP